MALSADAREETRAAIESAEVAPKCTESARGYYFEAVRDYEKDDAWIADLRAFVAKHKGPM